MKNNSLQREYFSDKVDTCKSLSSCIIPNVFCEIGSQAFYDWESCRYVVIPPSVKKIADDAFLWDNLHLVISNNEFFQNSVHSFQVFPYVNDEFASSMVSMFEKIESIDTKVDIKSDDIIKKRDMLNQEIEDVLQKLEKKESDLQKKASSLEKEYSDLKMKSDEESQFMKKIHNKVNKLIKDGVNQELKNVKNECDNFQKLQKSETEAAKKLLEDLKNDVKDAVFEEGKRLAKVQVECEKALKSIEQRKEELADMIADKALEKAMVKTPYKMISIVIDNKKKESNKPKILHHQFEDVLKLVSAGFNPLLVGPAGCGKNVIIEQVADILDWKFYYVNDVTEEYKVMGFVDANGHYCKTQFYEAFTNGGFIMIDELDQSNASALLAINSAVGTGYHEYASFPDGKCYPKHADFHIAAAANTYGNGANMLYCGRNQLDVASLNRFTPIYIYYDNTLESNLVYNQDFLPLYWKIRKIIETNRIRQVISTRNIVNADKMISNELFDLDKIFDFTLTQGMSNEDLRIILSELDKTVSTGYYEDKFCYYLQKVKKISTKEY